MPGTVTATCISHIIDVEEGFGSSATTAASLGSSTMPLAYYYGHENPSENVKLYKLTLSRLAYAVKSRLAADEESRSSGCIIDTAGLIDHVGYDLIQHAVDEFSGSIHESMHWEKSDLSKYYFYSQRRDCFGSWASIQRYVTNVERKTACVRCQTHQIWRSRWTWSPIPYSITTKQDPRILLRHTKGRTFTILDACQF